MFEVNTMHAPTRPRLGAVGLFLPFLALPGCVDEADMFKSKPDGPPNSATAPSASSGTATSIDSGGDAGSVASLGTAHDSSVTGDNQSAVTSLPTMASGTELVAETSSPSDGPAPIEDSGAPGVTIPPGDVPAELVGVWQQTRASSSDYEDAFGETFSEVSGFSVQLKITADGRYYLAHYTSGVLGDCRSVTQFDESVGTATLQGNVLTLQPASRRIDLSDCDSESSDDTNLGSIVLTVRLSEGREAYGGMRTFVMAAEGYGFPLSLTSLFREPAYVPEQPPQPEEFVLGVNGPFADLQGLWLVSAVGTDTNFYNPATDEFYFPELNGSSHQWLRFEGGGYEAAVALQNVNSEGVCKLDLIYYERGTAAFEVLEDVEVLGSHFIGHVALDASDSRLIVNVRECGADDGAFRYDLEPLTSYFRWIYFSPDRPPESFTLSCDFAKSEWQSLLCDDGTVGFVRPE